MMPNRSLHYFSICLSSLKMGADGETRTLVGQRRAVYETAAVCKHLSLLSHIGEMACRRSISTRVTSRGSRGASLEWIRRVCFTKRDTCSAWYIAPTERAS